MKLGGRGFTRPGRFRRSSLYLSRHGGGKSLGRHRPGGERGTFAARRVLRLNRSCGDARRRPGRRVREDPRNLEILARGSSLRQQHRAGRGKCSRSEEHTSELQSPYDLVCRLLLEKKNNNRMRREEHAFVISFGL